MPPPTDPTRATETGGDDADATDLADRYGAPPAWRGPALLAAVGVVVLAFGGWLAWTTVAQAAPPASSANLRWEILDDRSATATFDLELRDPSVEATCTLRAYALDHVLVGTVSFVAEPDAAGEVTRTVATERRATSVELLGCTAPGQNRPG